jgi:cell division protein FtsQ
VTDRRVLFRRRLIVMLIFTFLAGIAYVVYTLRIEEIRVTGLRTLDPKQVIRASGLHGGERIMWIRLSATARRIERIPAVQSATAQRSLPETVVLKVRERTPIAALGGRGALATDAFGRIFRSRVAGSLPVLEGYHGHTPGSYVDHSSRIVVDAFGSFPRLIRSQTARIVVGPPLTLVLTNGVEIRFGRYNDLERKARVAAAVLDAERGTELGYIDVRAPDVPVTRDKAPPSPSPTVAPAPRVPVAPQVPETPAPTPSPAATPVPRPTGPLVEPL